ncbi:MAG TPA: hypothetical protein VHM24_02950, partial [Gemmatimonadaceae bacterium]|nr:hypothetical protein [Gemmatimonadaceae bacterium]
MTAAHLVFTAERRLRAPWRVILFLAVLFGALLVTEGVESYIHWVVTRRGYELLVEEWSVPLGILLATAVMLKWV